MDDNIHMLIGDLLHEYESNNYDWNTIDNDFTDLEEIVKNGIKLEELKNYPHFISGLQSLLNEINSFDPDVEFLPDIVDIDDNDIEIDDDWTEDDVIEAKLEIAYDEQKEYQFQVVDWIQEKLRIVIDDLKHFDNPDHYVEKLLQKNETLNVELKETLRYDVHQQKNNTEMEDEVSQSLAAFMNTAGGNVIIGVNNDCIPIGLERDFVTVKGNNWDGFVQLLTRLVKDSLGTLAHNNLRIFEVNFKGKQVCLCRVKFSNKPIFTKLKSGNKPKKFFYRLENSTIELDAEEIYNYISEKRPNFKK